MEMPAEPSLSREPSFTGGARIHGAGLAPAVATMLSSLESDSKPFVLRHLLGALGRTMDRPWGSVWSAVVGPRWKRPDLLVLGKE
jgi:hypothetical protein